RPSSPASAWMSARSLHDALPICLTQDAGQFDIFADALRAVGRAVAGEPLGSDVAFGHELLGPGLHPVRFQGEAEGAGVGGDFLRSEEHTSELQSRENLVCRLLLE